MTFWQFAFKNVTERQSLFRLFCKQCVLHRNFFSFAVYLFHPKLHMTGVNSLNILMTISEVVIVFFSFFFLLYSIGTFLKVRKTSWDFNSTWHISKAIKRLVFLENMLIGVLSIFFGIQLGLSFHSSFISYRQNYTCTWSIFILAYRRYHFNNSSLSRSLYLCIVFHTDAHPYEKSCKTFKRRNTKKEKHPCSSLFWCDMLNNWICISAIHCILFR